MSERWSVERMLAVAAICAALFWVVVAIIVWEVMQ